MYELMYDLLVDTTHYEVNNFYVRGLAALGNFTIYPKNAKTHGFTNPCKFSIHSKLQRKMHLIQSLKVKVV